MLLEIGIALLLAKLLGYVFEKIKQPVQQKPIPKNGNQFIRTRFFKKGLSEIDKKSLY